MGDDDIAIAVKLIDAQPVPRQGVGGRGRWSDGGSGGGGAKVVGG
jgi:hypothetical protein